MPRSSNHFITVSRDGRLMARRKGAAPVCVARAEHGLEVETDADAIAAGVGERVVVRFDAGGANRELWVTAVVVDGVVVAIDDLEARVGITDERLAAWIRRAIERALDAAAPAKR